MTLSVGVVGAGAAGLEAARRLARSGCDVQVMEAREQFGGQARSFLFHGQPADRFAHILSPTDESLLSVLQELGLYGSIRWSEIKKGYYIQGRKVSLSSFRDLIAYRDLGLAAKIRFAFSQAGVSRIDRWENLDNGS